MNIINEMLVDKCFPDNVNARAVVPAYKDKTASGNPITLTDSEENKPLNMKLYGWSKQDGEPTPDNPVEIESAGMKWSTGKNLINADEYYSQFKQSDGTYKAKTVTLNDIRISLSEFVGKEITISVKLTVGANITAVFISYNGSELNHINGSIVASGLTGKSTLTIKPVSNTDYFVISFGSGNDDVIFSELQLELGSVATSYEPYTGGIPKPYGDKVELSVRGKNIFNFKKEDVIYKYIPDSLRIPGGILDINKGVSSATIWLIVTELKNLDNQKMILSAKSDRKLRITYIFTDTNNTVLSSFNYSGAITERRIPLTVPQNAAKLYVNIFDVLPDEVTIQLEIGTVPTAYEPYHEPQSTSIITPNGLPGIPVPSNTAGITYTDAKGQAWIADEIDLERGKYVQNVRIKELTGQESYIVAETSYFSGSSANMYINVPDMIRDGEAMCNCLSKKPYVWTVKSAVGFATNLQQIHLRFPKAIIGVNDDAVLEDTKIAYKKYIKTLYDNGKPVVVQYILANSIERDLTSAELAEYIQLYSYKPTTVVENDSDCWMDVTYKAGTSGKSKNEALRWYFKNVMPLVG